MPDLQNARKFHFWISEANETINGNHDASPMDLNSLDIFSGTLGATYGVWVFEKQPTDGAVHMVNALRDTLTLQSSPWRSMNGRLLKKQSDGNPVFVQATCEANAGGCCTVAEMDGISWDEISLPGNNGHGVNATEHGKLLDIGKKLCPEEIDDMNPDNSPTVAAKIVLLSKDGKPAGCTVALAIAHFAVDGLGFFLFANYWSNLISGKANEQLFNKHSSVLQKYSRTTTRSSDGALPNDSPSNSWKYFSTENWIAAGTKYGTADVRLYFDRFSPQELTNMKRVASEKVSAPNYITTNDAICAHLWQCSLKLRLQECPWVLNSTSPITRLGVWVNIRSRLEFLNKLYTGVAVIERVGTSTIQDVVEKSIGENAQLVHQFVHNDYREKEICNELNWLEDWYRERKITDFSQIFISTDPMANDLSVTSWLTFPIYESDFGLGKASLFYPAHPIAHNVVIIVPAPDGGVNFAWGVPEVLLKPLENETWQNVLHSFK